MSSATDFEARQTARAALLEQYIAEARILAERRGKSSRCLGAQHDECTPEYRAVLAEDCLCTCHDPKNTYWVQWINDNGVLHAGGMVSGLYDTANEAIDDGFAAKSAEAAWIRNQIQQGRHVIEQVDEERWNALMDWDEKTDAEKNELRAAIRAGDDDA